MNDFSHNVNVNVKHGRVKRERSNFFTNRNTQICLLLNILMDTEIENGGQRSFGHQTSYCSASAET